MIGYEDRMLGKLVHERKTVASYSGCWLKDYFLKIDELITCFSSFKYV